MSKYRLNHEDFLWLWEEDRWDGFLSGYASYKNKPVYLKCKRDFCFYKPGPIVNGIEDEKQSDCWIHRVLGVYSITPEQFWNANVRHLKWRECVGWHCDLEPGIMYQRVDYGNNQVNRKGYDAFKEWVDKNPLEPLVLTRDNFIGYLHY